MRGDFPRPRWSRPLLDQDGEEPISPEEFRDFASIIIKPRRQEPDHPTDPGVWLESHKMTQTEVALRLAQYLLVHRVASSDVSVALTGHELTRRGRPQFPVARYLTERGFQPKRLTDGWRANYVLKGSPHLLHLSKESADDRADVVATLATGGRLLAHVSHGSLEPTRSPAEHKILRSVIGRAITCESAGPYDLIAAVVPRSKRFRQLAARWRETEGARRSRVLILTVDRTGSVRGLSHDD